MLGWLWRGGSRRKVVTRESRLRSRLADVAVNAMVDVAKENADTTKLFKDAIENWHADGAIRQNVRKKARYEFINNAYLRGMVRTKQVDLIGTGPRLHVLSEDREAAAEVEAKFDQWLKDIGGARKLRSMVFEWIVGGDAFCALQTNENSPNPVKLDVRPLDPEQIAKMDDPEKRLLEGIQYDDFGNPVQYWVLPTHPSGAQVVSTEDAVPFDARFVCHVYTQDRASQLRGLSELASSLLPAALLRSFTLAVVKASNIAASLSFVVHTDEVPEGESTACEPYDVIDLEHGTGMALPDGYKATQLKAEQPVSTYAEFKSEMLNEVGRSILMPRLKVSGDASAYNYSSGRLDGQEYYHACAVERSEIEQLVLRKWFAEWWREAVTVDGYLSPGAQALVADGDYPQYPKHRWGWDGRPHVDPQKEALAEATHLASGSLGLHQIYAERGQNADDEMTKAARALGMTIDEYRKAVAASIFKTQGAAEEAKENEKHPSSE